MHDTARLNWLEANPDRITRARGYLGAADSWVLRTENGSADFATVREAIDSGMGVSPSGFVDSLLDALTGPKPLATKQARGVLVMKGGKAWGVTYEDGHSRSYGWVDPATAPLHDARYCRSPLDVTYAGDHYGHEQLNGAELVPVVRTVTVERA